MGLKSKEPNRKGQMRVVEALISCFIIVLAFTISAYFSNSYTGVRRGEMENTSLNLAGLLGSQSLLEKVAGRRGNWQQDLKSSIESLLPANAYYTLTLHSATQGIDLAQISNIFGQNITGDMNTATARRVITIALPMERNESKEIDAMLILDRSGSMAQKVPGDPYPKIDYLKNSSKFFVDTMPMSTSRVGISSFSTTARLDIQLTSNSALLKSTIDGLSPEYWTDIGDAIMLAKDEIQQNARNGSSWVAILITDGKANRPIDETYARQYTIDQAAQLSALNVDIYTIGLGNGTSDFDEALLKQIQTTGYYYAPSAQELNQIYDLIISDMLYRTRFDVIILELTVMRPGKLN